jgi:hypothetical protein
MPILIRHLPRSLQLKGQELDISVEKGAEGG